MLDLAENPQHRQPKTYGPFFGVLLLPLLFLAAAASIPYGFVVIALYRARAKRFARQMAARHRVMVFSDLIQTLEAGKGTMIREWKSPLKGPTRFWFTGDDVFARSPFSIEQHASWDANAKVLPFPRWCFDEYISPSNGKALFVAMTKKQRQTLREKFKDVRRIDVPTLTAEGW